MVTKILCEVSIPKSVREGVNVTTSKARVDVDVSSLPAYAQEFLAVNLQPDSLSLGEVCVTPEVLKLRWSNDLPVGLSGDLQACRSPREFQICSTCTQAEFLRSVDLVVDQVRDMCREELLEAEAKFEKDLADATAELLSEHPLQKQWGARASDCDVSWYVRDGRPFLGVPMANEQVDFSGVFRPNEQMVPTWRHISSEAVRDKIIEVYPDAVAQVDYNARQETEVVLVEKRLQWEFARYMKALMSKARDGVRRQLYLKAVAKSTLQDLGTIREMLDKGRVDGAWCITRWLAATYEMDVQYECFEDVDEEGDVVDLFRRETIARKKLLESLEELVAEFRGVFKVQVEHRSTGWYPEHGSELKAAFLITIRDTSDGCVTHTGEVFSAVATATL